MRFKTGDLVEYNVVIETYMPAARPGIGIVVGQRKTDVLVYSIREGKQILVRAWGTTLLSGVDRGE